MGTSSWMLDMGARGSATVGRRHHGWGCSAIVGIITAVVGLIVMTNLHTLILTWLVNVIFKN